MGVYHLMGLGRSPGAITGPISYLAHRYQQWNADDQTFFERSGEVAQRAKEKQKKEQKARARQKKIKEGEESPKLGDMQSLILFTTPEVIDGSCKCFKYVKNPPGQVTQQPEYPEAPMQEVLNDLLRNAWAKLSDRPKGSIFWVEIDRRDIRLTYERIIYVIAALARVGGQGKEMWVNLTGGNNVTNFALQVAATLSGEVARLYYVQAADHNAEKCVNFTNENNYWVDLPIMPLNWNTLNADILRLIENTSAVGLDDIYSQLKGLRWNLLQDISDVQVFKTTYLRPMWKQGLLAEEDNQYFVGSQWKVVKPYADIWQQAKQIDSTLEQLSEQKSWIKHEEIQIV
jgi:hypothetical protein